MSRLEFKKKRNKKNANSKMGIPSKWASSNSLCGDRWKRNNGASSTELSVPQ